MLSTCNGAIQYHSWILGCRITSVLAFATVDRTFDHCIYQDIKEWKWFTWFLLSALVISRLNIGLASFVWSPSYTLYNVILRIARNCLETRVIIKISIHPCCPRNFDWFSMGWSKKNKKIPKKKIQNGWLKQIEFFNSLDSQYWVSRIGLMLSF